MKLVIMNNFKCLINNIKSIVNHSHPEQNRRVTIRFSRSYFICAKNSRISIKHIFTRLIVAILLLVLYSCSMDNNSPDNTVARVDERAFKEDEIAFAYELAPRQLTKLGKEKTLDILLDKMMNRKLLADEARKRNLHQDSLLQRLIKYYEDAEIIRQLYLRHVRDSVSVSEQEIRKAFTRSNQILFVKHFVTDDSSSARQIRADNQLPEHIPLAGSASLIELPKYGKVDSIGWNVLDRRIEDILYSLPLNKISEPIKLEDRYHLFKLIDKRQNIILGEGRYINRRPSLKSAIRKRKEHRQAFNYVQRIMQPEKLIIKAPMLNQLTDFIYAHYHNSSQLSMKIKTDEVVLEKIESAGIYDREIATYQSGNFKVSDFFFYNRVNPQPIAIKSKATIRNRLKHIIAAYVRDAVFAEIGRTEKLDKLPVVQNEKQIWQERLFANQLKRALYQDIGAQAGSEVAEIYYERITELLKDLREEAEIAINREKLYSIETSDEGLPRKIDFFARHF